jgi:hypothetical protein
VVAVQNPLTSLADDVAATRRAVALQDGPVLLVLLDHKSCRINSIEAIDLKRVFY